MTRPRFTMELVLRDNHDVSQAPICMRIDVDQALRISSRDVDELKMCADLGIPSPIGFDGMVKMMRAREFRKELFVRLAEQLGASMAERMEDAEGWNDTSRIEPARRVLGGQW